MKNLKYALGALITVFSTVIHTSNQSDTTAQFLAGTYKSGKDSYRELTKSPEDSVSIGIGISDSQNGHRNNTMHPDTLAVLLHRASEKSSNPAQWLKQHWGFVARVLPQVTCNDCKKHTQLDKITVKNDEKTIDRITQVIAANSKAEKAKEIGITIGTCHHCCSRNIQEPKKITPLTDTQADQMIQQLLILGALKKDENGKNVRTSAGGTLPTYRLSIELADILQGNTDQVDTTKLNKTAKRLENLGHPLTFMHHYANPACKPDLFQDEADIQWFAERCADVVRACPGLTHVCPISQIMGFGMQTARGNLPPFEVKINKGQFLKNIVQAQVEAGRAMKKINPKVKVLVSHQWKPMYPEHGKLDPRYLLELGISSIASSMYNQEFVNLVKPHINEIDGIALSVYPRLKFNIAQPNDANCSGDIDPEAVLEAIEKTAEAFPGKDIYIVETGCNKKFDDPKKDAENKKKFIDMTLQACTIARKKGIPIKTCFFWGHVQEQYSEWNKIPEQSDFSVFPTYASQKPNPGGEHLIDVTKQ